MNKNNAELGYSFNLPDSLTVDQLDAYQLAVNKAITELKGPLTDMRYFAIIFAVAAQVGWLADWKCEAMPSLTGALGAVDAKVVIAVGKVVRDFVKGYTDISPT